MDSFIRDNGKIERNDVNVNRLDAMVSAMWELLIEKGYTREELNAKLDKVKEQKLTLDPQRTKVICFLFAERRSVIFRLCRLKENASTAGIQ